MPAWRQGMAVGEWRQIPNSALSSAPTTVKAPGNTGPLSKVIAWNSFVIDPRDATVFSPANGGHHDYSGNEVNSIRLSDASPRWIERRASSSVSAIVENVTHYADGRPTSRHSYYGAAFNQVRNRIMLVGGSRWGNGFITSTVDGFNVAANDWDAAGTYPNAPSGAVELPETAFVEDPTTGDIYAFAGYAVYRWSSATNRWTTLVSGTSAYGFEAACAFDTRRNRILLVAGQGDRHLFTVAGNTMQTVSLGGSSAGQISGGACGMVYEPWLDAYLFRKAGAGSTVYRINAQTFAVDVLPVTGGGSIPNAINGVYRRFLFAPTLGGVVYCPAYDSNMWFLRTT
jgi:hypothetical protein